MRLFFNYFPFLLIRVLTFVCVSVCLSVIALRKTINIPKVLHYNVCNRSHIQHNQYHCYSISATNSHMSLIPMHKDKSEVYLVDKRTFSFILMVVII